MLLSSYVVVVVGCVVVVSAVDYVEYRRGSSPIILSAPHGGSLKPANIKPRDYGCWQNGRCVWTHDCGAKDKKRCVAKGRSDYWTKSLAELVADELTSLSGKRPHLVICHLHRSRLDINREIKQAAFGVPEMEAAWRQYHKFIRDAKANIGTAGILFDIHGQSHPEDWIELGYALKSSELTNAYEELYKKSSIRHLVEKSSDSFLELLRGRTSLGGELERVGYRNRVVPSPTIPIPGKKNYYSGGYITREHGSRDGGKVDAIQIESPRSLRGSKAGPKYAKNLALAIHRAFSDIYGNS